MKLADDATPSDVGAATTVRPLSGRRSGRVFWRWRLLHAASVSDSVGRNPAALTAQNETILAGYNLPSIRAATLVLSPLLGLVTLTMNIGSRPIRASIPKPNNACVGYENF